MASASVAPKISKGFYTRHAQQKVLASLQPELAPELGPHQYHFGQGISQAHGAISPKAPSSSAVGSPWISIFHVTWLFLPSHSQPSQAFSACLSSSVIFGLCLSETNEHIQQHTGRAATATGVKGSKITPWRVAHSGCSPTLSLPLPTCSSPCDKDHTPPEPSPALHKTLSPRGQMEMTRTNLLLSSFSPPLLPGPIGVSSVPSPSQTNGVIANFPLCSSPALLFPMALLFPHGLLVYFGAPNCI